MIIHGREIELRRTVQAEIEIGDMCPDGNITNLAEFLFKQTVTSRMRLNNARFIAALSRAGEAAKAFEVDGYEPNPVTVEELQTVTPYEFNKLIEVALQVFADDGKTTIEIEPSKKKEPGRK